jgi:hypothetical protein
MHAIPFLSLSCSTSSWSTASSGLLTPEALGMYLVALQEPMATMSHPSTSKHKKFTNMSNFYIGSKVVDPKEKEFQYWSQCYCSSDLIT